MKVILTKLKNIFVYFILIKKTLIIEKKIPFSVKLCCQLLFTNSQRYRVKIVYCNLLIEIYKGFTILERKLSTNYLKY